MPTSPPSYPRPSILDAIPLDRHAVIEASAGTGKTYTLEHLVVDRLLRTDATLDHILVVTFTEKATGELRARIRQLIERMLAFAATADATASIDTSPASVWRLDAEARRRLEAALFSFDRATIFTIHGWCRRVLRDLAFDGGQPFEQTRVDGDRIFHRAFREALRHEISVEAPLRCLLTAWLDGTGDERALERLLRDALRDGYLEGRLPLEQAMPAAVAALRESFDAGVLHAAYADAAIQRPSFVRAEQVLQDLATTLTARPQDDAAAFDAVLSTVDVGALLRPRRTAARPDASPPRRAFPEGLPATARRFIASLRAMSTLQGERDSLERAVVDAFLPRVAARLDALKRRDGLFDFDDLLQRVWDALRGPRGEAVRSALRARHRFALIDEFQDTDARQWDIFRTVFVDASADARPQANVLTVIGDPKQAIYGFRGADVFTYLAARERLLADGATRVPLRVNHRSTPAMVSALNRLLDDAGRAALLTGDIRYDEPVEAGRATLRLTDAAGADAPPIVAWAFRPPPPRRAGDRTVPSWQLTRAYGRHMARSLARLLNEPAERLFLCASRPGEPSDRRPLTAGDVFILVRTGWEAVDAAEQLRRAGVPYSFYKQEGLFQTPEASDVLDVLTAVARPQDRAARLRAFATPFFGVPWRELTSYRALPGGHPLLERLHDWKLLAEREQHAALYHALLHDSGLMERELFLRDTERELTNYQHIIEVLLEVGAARRLSLTETLALLRRYVEGSEAPEGGDGNTQRLPTEQDAVQIMTLHKSKGLEAPVVCLYGGWSPGFSPRVQVIHPRALAGTDPPAAGARRVLIGKAALDAAADQIEAEARGEDQRLLYVAVTRAAARLYLPWIETTRALNGTCEPLNRRLSALLDEDPAALSVEPVDARPPPDDHDGATLAGLASWTPPPGLLTPPAVDDRYARARSTHAPLVVTSYTRMKQAQETRAAEEAPLDVDEFKLDLGSAAEARDDALPGGRHVGRFLHEAIEALDFASLDAPFEDWAARPEVQHAFATTMRRHDVEPRWLSVGQRLVHETLTRAFPLGETVVDGLFRCRELREMEFLFPVPESGHPLLADLAGAGSGASPGGGDLSDGPAWRVERGFVKGFVDLTFEHGGRTWWADWKSDQLRRYDAATIGAHVAEHYDLQARLYTLALVRLLGVRDAEHYDQRFGGYLYVFLRGMGPDAAPGEGVFWARPSWDAVIAWEDALRREVFA